MLPLLVLLQVAASTANEWRQVSSNTSGTVYLMRERDIENETNPNPVVWVKADHSKNAKEKARTSMIRYTFDCAGERIRLEAWTDYDAQGSVIASMPSYISNPFKVIVPESTGATMAMWACPSTK